MKTLFDVTTINGMELRNRFVRSATWEGMCDEQGRPTKRLSECFGALAQGGVGLIITGYAYVRPDGKQMIGSIGAYTGEIAPEMKEVAATVHAQGGKICLQLVHCGGQARAQAGRKNVAPSAIESPQYSSVPEELSLRDIDDLIAAFGAGARRAKEWGFDAVQLHAAHGYLINQFLSSLTNRRTDAYGGNLENRMRFMLDVLRSVRSAVGPAYPVLVKLNGSDFISGGLTSDEAVCAAVALNAEGIDAIEVSGGTPASGDQVPVRPKIERREQEGYNLPLAVLIKNAVSCPVMVVGGFRSFDLVKSVIEKNEADYVSLARPFIREPELVKRWQAGDTARARCISCNGCFRPGMRDGGIACVIDKIEQKNKNLSL